MSSTHHETPYAGLSPDLVLDAIDASGLRSDGRLLALNSYENRVYQVGLEDGRFVVAKFYRPARWSDAAIEEEHAFACELAAAELPVVAPLAFGGASLLCFEGFRYALYPRRGGRAPALESAEQLEWMGRLIARMHGIGARQPFQHRQRLDRQVFITAPSQVVLDSVLLPPHLTDVYADAVEQVDQAVAARFDAVGPVRSLRLHGDCHPGNVLWTDGSAHTPQTARAEALRVGSQRDPGGGASLAHGAAMHGAARHHPDHAENQRDPFAVHGPAHGPHFVDLDDARSGPAVQDLWMLANDERSMRALLEGYAQFRDFDAAELALIPALRAMRQVHHAGWIAQRWHDPAFPAAFPYAADARWWQEHIDDLDEAVDAFG